MKMKQKTFRAAMEIKADGAEGAVRAVFATLNVIDHDGDVTPVGAFSEQDVIIEPWNHGWELPAGKGKIFADEEKAWLEGQFFLDTAVGLENYKTVKAMGDLAEWSYTFNVVEGATGEFDGQDVYYLNKLDVVGVSPVTRGAGIGTGTVAVKSQVPGTDDDDVDPEGEGIDGDAVDFKPSGLNLLRTRIDILEIEAGVDPAEE